MDLSMIKNVSPNKHLFKKILALLFSLIVIAVSFIVITNSNKAAQDTVEILRVKQDGGIPAATVITEDQIERYRMIMKEVTSDMLLADDLSSVVGKYTKYFLRDESALYEDQFMEEKPQKNEWLYKMDEDSELLTLPYNYLEAGGDILMPGDRVRVRISYETDESPKMTGNPNELYSSSQGTITKTEVLFDSIVVKDMLNVNSHSIYEVYKEVLKLSEDKRQDAMKSKEFLKSILPKALLLEGSTEQINHYAKYKAKEEQSLLITILSRSNSDVIVDQLPTLQREVESWVEEQNGQ